MLASYVVPLGLPDTCSQAHTIGISSPDKSGSSTSRPVETKKPLKSAVFVVPSGLEPELF